MPEFFLFNRNKIYDFKVDNKNVNFPTEFCLETVSENFSAVESKEISYKGNVYGFSVDCKTIDESDILKIHRYLVVKIIIK